MTKAQTQGKAIAVNLRVAAQVFEDCGDFGKIDWAKLLELFMQFLPLILQFLKPQEEPPKPE